MKLTLEQFETQWAESNLSTTDWFDTTYGLFKELEALQSRSCEGCKYLEQKFHHISPRCVVHEYLLTNYSKKVFCCNRYEAKDTKCY